MGHVTECVELVTPTVMSERCKLSEFRLVRPQVDEPVEPADRQHVHENRGFGVQVAVYACAHRLYAVLPKMLYLIEPSRSREEHLPELLNIGFILICRATTPQLVGILKSDHVRSDNGLRHA